MQEIILIDKPRGITSYDVIRRLKPRFPKGTKIGHAGTLDPQATGLMIIGIGTGTKKLNEYLKLPKIYEAEVLFGIQTDSGDLDGKIITEQNVPDLDRTAVEVQLQKIVGKIKLAVPMYSAIKIAGQPLYKYARRGDASVAAPIKEMEIKWAKLHNLKCANSDAADNNLHSSSDSQINAISATIKNFCVAKIELEVASGTYIRSIAEELGRRLKLPATLQNLRRTRIGDFKIEDAEKIQ